MVCSPSCKGITVGHSITFSCKPGYRFADDQTSVASCGADRTWSLSSTPACKGEPVSPHNVHSVIDGDHMI